MGAFQFSGLHHVAFATSDIHKTIEYWRDLLGFNIVYGVREDGLHQIGFRISQQMMIFFFEWKDVEPVKPKRHGEPVNGPFIFDHLAIHLDSEKELFRLQDQLVCAELPVSDVIDHVFLHSIYTYDPNGIPLEFTWVCPDIDLDANPLLIVENGGVDSFPQILPKPDVWPKCEEEPDDLRIIIPGKEQKYLSNT